MRLSALATVVSAAALFAASSASAADLGGNCCADLEERIAELEATTVRKGNRKVSLTLSGRVNQAILYWNDGHESNNYVVENIAYPSAFNLSGSAEIAKGLSAGYTLEIWTNSNNSAFVDQDNDSVRQAPFLWLSYWYLESDKYGKLAVGLNSRPSDVAPEQDLSDTVDPSYSLGSDIGFGFLLRRNDGGLSGVLWGSLSGYNFTGETANIVRYDTPDWGGLKFAVSFGEDDMFDVAAFYAKDHGPLTINAAVAYTHVNDENGFLGLGPEFPGPPGAPQLQRLHTDTVTGSISVLHNPSGLNATIAAGQRSFDGTLVVDNDGRGREPADNWYVWAKLGLIAKLNSFGNTNFYAEYGYYEDGISVGVDPTSLSVANDDTLLCAGAGNACLVAGSESTIWGFGYSQNIDAAEMKLYTGFRHWEADVDLVDVNGAAVPTVGIEDHWHIISGARINF